MDLSTLVVPGAQSVASAILTDAWNTARAALARAWNRSAANGQGSGGETERGEQASTDLDLACRQSLELAADGSADECEARLKLYWAGYLAAATQAHPELLEVLADLPYLLSDIGGTSPANSTTTSNSVSGTVHGSMVQTGNVQGSITFGKP